MEDRKMIYVGNLPAGVIEQHLHEAFIPFGEINQILLPQAATSKATEMAQAKNFALIEFEDNEDSEHAIFNMNESEFFGKVIAVHWAKNSHKQQVMGKQKAIWH